MSLLGPRSWDHVSRAACGDPWKESGDISDSGSSGHWSGSSGSSTPSPPHPQASPKYLGDAFGSPQTDHGFETDTDPFLLDEPAPRKRKNSVKVMYKCLWPSCGKVLRSIVGIKRHVKALHLGDTVDSDQFKREEDFYYTEMQMKEDCAVAVAAPPPPGTPTGEPVSTSRVTSPSLAALSLPPAKVQSSGPEHPGLESSLPPVALSKSAPGSFWHIQADHAYQALPAFQIPVSPHIYTSISWAAAPTTTSSLSPVRSRSLSFSEPQQPPPTVKSHLIVTSPPRAQSSTRKARGEAKKCRKERAKIDQGYSAANRRPKSLPRPPPHPTLSGTTYASKVGQTGCLARFRAELGNPLLFQLFQNGL